MSTAIPPNTTSPTNTASPIPSHVPGRVLSCVLCAQRKVKCDKRQPCTNCVKAGVTCRPGVPTRPQRRRRHGHRLMEDIVAKCQRYERLLISHGFKKEDLDAGLDVSSGTSPDSKAAVTRALPPQDAQPPDTLHGNSMGSSNYLWISLSDEILNEEDSTADGNQEDVDDTPDDDSEQDESLMVLNALPTKANLTLLHPSPVHIFQLWQTYLDNVEPLTKLFHTPTLQKEILANASDITSISPAMEALMFSIYAAATHSMSEDDCRNKLGESKDAASDRFIFGTKQALMAANLLKTVDMMLLQAFILYIYCVRYNYNALELCMLTGLAVRMCQRLGLHREDLLQERPVLEAELGRRIWWQVVILEAPCAESAGVMTTTSNRLWNTRKPLNVNDVDLYPDMSDPPLEHIGITEESFGLVRASIVEFLRKPPLNGRWAYLINYKVPVAQREQTVNDLEEHMRRKYLDHLDMAIPMHELLQSVCYSAIDRMRLMAIHPRQYPDRGASLPQHEKDRLFTLCFNIIARTNAAYFKDQFKAFVWQTRSRFQTDAFVYLVDALRTECIGQRADATWNELLLVFEHRHEILKEMTRGKKPAYAAMGNLFLKSWKARVDAYAELNLVPPEGVAPPVIATLSARRKTGLGTAGQTPAFGHTGLSPGAAAPMEFFGDATTMVDTASPFDLAVNWEASSSDWSHWKDMMMSFRDADLGEYSEIPRQA